MPTYVYECQNCNHRFEKFQSMSARVMRKCPECEERKLNRLIGPGAGFLFKGDGFYITDYRSKSYSDDKTADTKPSSDKADKSKDKKPSSE